MDNNLTNITQLHELNELSSESITDDTLLLVECKQSRDGIKTYTGYETKSITYGALKKNISNTIGFGNISSYVYEVLSRLYVPETEIKIKEKDNDVYVISAFNSTGRGVTTALSTYSLYGTVSDIFTNNEFENISATNSPWVKKVVITDNINGNSQTNVVSQISLSGLSSEISGEYINKTSIEDVIDSNADGDIETDAIASQKLVSDLSTCIDTSYIKNSNIGNSLEYGSDYVANISCVKSLSSDINDNYILSINITQNFIDLGSDINKVVSEKVIYEISGDISSNYAKDEYLKKVDNLTIVGDSTDKSASQKLIYDLSGVINSHLNEFPEDGKVLYCGKNNTISSKDVCQDFAVFLPEDNINNISIDFGGRVPSSVKFKRDVPKYYTLFGDGVTDDNVYELTASLSDVANKNVKLTSLYGVLSIDNITLTSNNYFDTTKFNLVPEGTFVYNKKTKKKFYFIDKNFIQF